MNNNVGDIVKVTVTSLENYGIFVKFNDKDTGLIHISEMSDKFVSNVRNFAYPGEVIYAKIIAYNKELNQYKLSIKSIDYRITKSKGRIVESPNGFTNLKKNLEIWVQNKLKEIKNEKN